jgi:hypothetical protein
MAGADVCMPLVNSNRERVGTLTVACTRTSSPSVTNKKARDQWNRSVRLDKQFQKNSPQRAAVVALAAKQQCLVEISVRPSAIVFVCLALLGLIIGYFCCR